MARKLIDFTRNPDNGKQFCLRYDMIGAYNAGENGHPQDVVKELAKALGCKAIGAIPFSIGDCWIFWLEVVDDAKGQEVSIPDYIETHDWVALDYFREKRE